MRTEQVVLLQLTEWAESNELVRAVVLTSSRVMPGSLIDFLSDYDIELYVSDLTPFQAGDDWLSFLGSIMVRWPYQPRTTFHPDWLTRLVLFKDGVRTDFQITDNFVVQPDAYENGYRILLDKDRILADLKDPTFTKFIVKKPTIEEYERLVHEFWWDAIYVPKYLWRDELPFAKYMLDNALRYSFLHKMIEWYIGIINDWSVNVGLWGKRFKHYLDPEIWRQLESTYAGTEIEENWTAFFETLDLFSKLAQQVAAHFNWDYPKELDQDVRQYCQKIRDKGDS